MEKKVLQKAADKASLPGGARAIKKAVVTKKTTPKSMKVVKAMKAMKKPAVPMKSAMKAMKGAKSKSGKKAMKYSKKNDTSDSGHKVQYNYTFIQCELSL